MVRPKYERKKLILNYYDVPQIQRRYVEVGDNTWEYFQALLEAGGYSKGGHQIILKEIKNENPEPKT